MLQPNSRINLDNGIKFYEQDILFIKLDAVI